MAKYILVSDGENRKIPDYPSEAEFLKSIAIKEGVPLEAALCEEKVRNTYENRDRALINYCLSDERRRLDGEA